MKHPRIIALVVIVLLAGWLGVHVMHNREPRYQGRTLTEWLEVYKNSMVPQRADREAMHEASISAVKQIGTNAIPFLVKKVSMPGEGYWKQRLSAWIRSHPWIGLRPSPPAEQRLLGVYGFEILGRDAESAIPALASLTRHPGPAVRLMAMDCLCKMKPEKQILLPILSPMLRDPNMILRKHAAMVFLELFPEEAEAAGVYKTYPALKPSGTNAFSTNAPVQNR